MQLFLIHSLLTSRGRIACLCLTVMRDDEIFLYVKEYKISHRSKYFVTTILRHLQGFEWAILLVGSQI